MSQDMTPEERDRLTRVETKLDVVLDKISNLPVSPAVKERFETLEATQKKHSETLDKITERLAWVSGAFAAIGILITYIGKYVYDHITIGFGGGN